MIFYFQYEKARLERKRIVEMSKGYGKPKVGGPFKLRDLNGKEFTEKDLLGKYSLVRMLCAETTTASLSCSSPKNCVTRANNAFRSISVSHTALISALTNLIRCPRPST